MLTQYNLKMPHAVYGGENAMDNITAIIKARGAKKVAMFTDKGIEGAGLFALPEEAVKASGAEYYVLDELPPEPSYMAVQKLVDEFKTSGADLIVACGGGSVMDAAKLASVLVTDDYGVKELLDNPGHRAGHPSRVSRTHPSSPLMKGSPFFDRLCARRKTIPPGACIIPE